LGDHLEPAEERHFDVGENEIGGILARAAQALTTVGRIAHAQAEGAQEAEQELARDGRVFDDEDMVLLARGARAARAAAADLTAERVVERVGIEEKEDAAVRRGRDPAHEIAAHGELFDALERERARIVVAIDARGEYAGAVLD